MNTGQAVQAVGWKRVPMLQRAVSQAANTITAAFAIMRDPLDADELIGLAQRRTGLVDFGSAPFEEPLQNLLRAGRAEPFRTLRDALGCGAISVQPAASA